MSNEAKQIVQAGLDRRKAERIFNNQDKEAIGAVAGKRDRERRSQEAEARRIREELVAHRQLLIQKEEEERIQEEAYEEELAQRWQDFKGAMPVALSLCAMGAIYFLGVHNPDVALVAGGLLVAAGLMYGGLALLPLAELLNGRQARCQKLHPECICARCANNRIGEDGVRCCWTAKQVIHHIKTRCSVQECSHFQEEQHDRK